MRFVEALKRVALKHDLYARFNSLPRPRMTGFALHPGLGCRGSRRAFCSFGLGTSFGFRISAFGFVLAAALPVLAGPETNAVFHQRAKAAFEQAQAQYQTNTSDPASAWQFGRACYDLADMATHDTERAAIAKQGIAACHALLARESNSAPGHYYLGMDYGQLAKAEAPSPAALRLVRQMEHEFKAAAALDGTFDFAGPARCLGLLYRDAPGWPFSIGSRRRARDWLEQAARLAPDYPENRLNLIESYLRWRDRAPARQELRVLEALWPKAQTNFTGERWEQSWVDWTARKKAAEQALGWVAQ